MFDAVKFLNNYSIPFIEDGKNTSIGFLNINCPFCGDTGNHLGVHKTKGYSSCWKCEPGYHSIYDLVEKLVPYENTKEIIKRYDSKHIFETKIHEKLNTNKVSKVKLPGEKLKRIHGDYLRSRNFNPQMLIKKYKILGTTHYGKHRYRIVIPIYYNHQLVTFQTRAINSDDIRYINADPEEEIIGIKDILYNLDNCNEDYVVLTEGCFKVFRLGKNSCASLGKNYKMSQVNLLVERFKKVYVWFDPDVPGQEKAHKICKELNDLGIEVHNIVSDVAPDDIDQKEADEFMSSIK